MDSAKAVGEGPGFQVYQKRFDKSDKLERKDEPLVTSTDDGFKKSIGDTSAITKEVIKAFAPLSKDKSASNDSEKPFVNEGRTELKQVKRADILKREFAEVVKSYKASHGEDSVQSGAMNTNIFRMLDYMSEMWPSGTALTKPFVTGQEKNLREAIVSKSTKESKKLSPAEVFHLSLELNKGNIHRALLTGHNCMFGLSRMDFELPNRKFPMKEKDFFTKYLNDDLTGANTNDTLKTQVDDVGGNWYYFFGLATMSHATHYRTNHVLPVLNILLDCKNLIGAACTLSLPGVIAFPIQLASDIAGLHDNIAYRLTGKTISQQLQEKLHLDSHNFPSPSPANLLPEFGINFEQAFFKTLDPRRIQHNLKKSLAYSLRNLWQVDRYSCAQASISVGESLANLKKG